MYEIGMYVFGVLAIYFPALFVLEKNEQNMSVCNRKYRFGRYITAFIFCIPIVSFFLCIISSKKYFNADSTFLVIMAFFISFVLAYLAFKVAYVPINQNIEKEIMEYRKLHEQNWRYYTLVCPAKSLRSIVKLGFVGNQFSTPEAIKKYQREILKEIPPTFIQLVLLALMWIITTPGLWLYDYLNNVSDEKTVYFNLYVIPFLLITVLVGEIIFVIIDFIEGLLKFEIPEKPKFILFGLFYIATVQMFWFFANHRLF